MAEYHVASLVVHARPEDMDRVARAIGTVPSAEVHAAEDGKLVVTVEGDDDATVRSGIDAISRIDGVQATALIVHQVEPIEDGERV